MNKLVDVVRIDLTGEVRDSDMGPWVDIVANMGNYRIPVATLVLNPRSGESLMNSAARTVSNKLKEIFSD